MYSKYNLARCPSLPGRRKGAQGSPRPSRDCGRARAGLSFLTAGCHLVMEEPRQRGPRLGTQGRALRLGGWSPGLCCARESRQGEEGWGLPKASVPQGCVCLALSTHRDVPEDLFVEVSRLSLPGPPLSRSPVPGQQHLLVLIQGSVSDCGGVEGESPADFCQCATSSGPSPQILGRGHLERGSCSLLCLQFPPGCLLSVNHPTKANTAGKD